MPSTSRRRFLAAAGTAATTAVSGCSAFTTSVADVDPGTGLDADTSAGLDGVAVYLAGETSDLPDPPTTTDSLADADAVLATPDANLADVVAAFRAGTTVAFAGGDAQRAVADALAADDNHRYGTETVVGRPVSVAAAVPHGDAASTYAFVDEGGWDDPVLDPVGWVEHGRLPACDTFVPESSADDEYAYAGSAFVAGRLETGETHATRTTATTRQYDDGERRVRLRTTVHAAANDGYAVDEARRATDFPNDEELRSWFPNPHERNGVRVGNHSDLLEERLEVEFTPTNSRARGALTGCCGATTDGAVAYDHRTSFRWKRDDLLGDDRHYASATGRGEWHLDA